MASVHPAWAVTVVLALGVAVAAISPGLAASPYSWQAPDRAARVAGLIPGRGVRMTPPDEFLRDWTRAQMARWEKDHPALPAERAYEAYAKAEPADAAMAALIPSHISPYGRLLSGKTTQERAEGAMLTYCPLCGQEQAYPYSFVIADPANPYHAQTYCCHQDLYEREQDFPPDYKLRPNSMADFPHLDGTVAQVPGYTFTDKAGCEWQIFPGTVVAYHRWLTAATQATSFMNAFKDSGAPLYAHKLAALLDRVADVYYGLPLSCMNELATGEDGKPLTRAEWESWPRPVRAGAPETKLRWNRRVPPSSRGWIFQYNELAWVEPFARVRHHPAFKAYSQRKYGDPEALDRKIMTRLMRDLALIFESSPLTSDYQDGSYADLMMLGMLLQDPYLFGFAAGHQECVLYNHHYHDGMNGEGAYNYMTMMCGYYAYMANPKGWLEFAPTFLQDHPFFAVASAELEKLHTVRDLPLEFGDEHIPAYDPAFQTDAKKVAANELRPSMNWPDYGIGLLRVGGPGHRQEVFMTYDKVSLHGASDKLGIACWVDGVPVMRDGGYAAPWDSAYLDESRPEIKSLQALPYPHPLFESVPRPDKKFECWNWAHGPWAHNTVTVNEQSTGPGWDDNEGLGDLVTYKGGEAPGEPGARFQVLDCRDLQSFERRGVPMQDFRRTLLAVEGPDGRPYTVDILRLRGGQRHALYQHAWGDPSETDLPAARAQETDLAAYWEKLRGATAGKLPSRQEYSDLRPVELLGPAPRQWGLTWQTDVAACAPFDVAGKRKRPISEDVGRVRLRLIGLEQQGETTLLRGKGPWVSTVHQPLPGGSTVQGNVGFEGAFDYLIESRSAPPDKTETNLRSDYVHVLEGFREGERTAIKGIERLPATGEATALKLFLAAGCTDTVLFQPGPGRWQGPDGVSTNARYALVRRSTRGEVIEADMVRGTSLTAGKFAARMAGDLQGTLVDLIGDLTGTRQETALIIRPSAPWPVGAGLAGRPVSIQVMNGHGETYTIEQVTALPDGLLRVDLAHHPPFTMGWYQVAMLDEKKPNRLYSNRQLWAGINTPLWWNCQAWFPERGQTFTIHKSDTDRTTMDLVEGVNLKAAGIQPDDWFTIYALEPGQAVSVPAELTWRQEIEAPGSPQTAGRPRPTCSTLRITGTTTLTLPARSGELWHRIGGGAWRRARTTFNAREETVTLTLDGNECAGQIVWLRSNKPG